MKRRFNTNQLNQLGYTEGAQSMYNTQNFIPSNNITMQNTPFPVNGQGFDVNGNPVTEQVVMQPGHNYQFKNASYVQEIPQFQVGGTFQGDNGLNQWNRQFLTGYANNTNQWNEAYLTGQGQPYQEVPTEIQQNMIETGYPTEVSPEETQEVVDGRFQFYNPYGGYSVENASFQLGQGIQQGNTLQTIGSGLKVLTGLGRNVLSGLGYENKNRQVMEEYRKQQRAGLTQQNRQQYLQEGGEVANQEQQLIDGVMQALQQGAQPEEVLQMLVQQGIDEQTAMQLIQAIMQQLQGQVPQAQAPQEQPIMQDGGTYLDKMKGKKIKNYTFNEKTGNYEVEFE